MYGDGSGAVRYKTAAQAALKAGSMGLAFGMGQKKLNEMIYGDSKGTLAWNPPVTDAVADLQRKLTKDIDAMITGFNK